MADDLLCFSHLRWDFVFQRPHHLLTRAATTMRVLYWEEPLWVEVGEPGYEIRETPEHVLVVQPRLVWGCDDVATLRDLLDRLVADLRVTRPILWYYTPHALAFSGHLAGNPVVYDCMDELSAFLGADPSLPLRERALMARSALVFTGGRSLFEAKRAHHPCVHAFPSGVDIAHFTPARQPLPEPESQRAIGHPRAGFYGVVDERLDQSLLASLAGLRPGVEFIIVGPVAKIDPDALPQAPNLHWLGAAPYADLPAYIAHWDVALMPFAMNDSTRFISPTKTPEYLAAGRPVISTPIVDVVSQYGGLAGVHIAADAAGFATALDHALTTPRQDWIDEADQMLAGMAWDETWARMLALVEAARTGAVTAE